jgi:phosphoglycerol transferase MdoB-like AlkP superfamily enzyme
MYGSLGFDKFISVQDYKLDELIGYAGYSLSDESFFRQSLDKIDTSKPFYGFMITLSSHHPYSFFEDYQYKDFNVGNMEKTYLGRYFKSINYLDSCIGKLVEDLKKRGLYDNTLLAIYGDHYAIPKTESAQMMNFLGLENNEYEWTKILKVPLIISCPGLPQGQTIETTAGEIDILPTIANLMGFEAPHAMGNDILNTEEGFAIIKNNTLVTDKFMYMIDEDNVYDPKKNAILNKDAFLNDIEKHKNDTSVAEIIIKKDAFKK